MYAVILAGGGGTRLHPLSRPERPKPFLPLLGRYSLLQLTVARLMDGEELDLRPEDITSYCRQHLSSDKVPRSVSFQDDLPHTLSGKVLKRQLRDKYWADSGSLV